MYPSTDRSGAGRGNRLWTKTTGAPPLTGTLSTLRAKLALSLLPRSPLPITVRSFLLHQPLLFGLWFQIRRLRYRAFGTRPDSIDQRPVAAARFTVEKALPYNREMMWAIRRGRTERLMNVLRSINGLDTRQARLLCIGPRNEAEVLLLTLHGFRRRNIVAIDLFSYSPLIRVMDMHELEFYDDSFDVVYSSYVITYSSELERACAEALRVCRDGGLMVFAFERLRPGQGNLFGANPLEDGTPQLLSCFDPHVDHVYWREEFEHAPGRFMCSVIFRIRKPAKRDAT
jgi:SAM-dependent methyltransferase